MHPSIIILLYSPGSSMKAEEEKNCFTEIKNSYGLELEDGEYAKFSANRVDCVWYQMKYKYFERKMFLNKRTRREVEALDGLK